MPTRQQSDTPVADRHPRNDDQRGGGTDGQQGGSHHDCRQDSAGQRQDRSHDRKSDHVHLPQQDAQHFTSPTTDMELVGLVQNPVECPHNQVVGNRL